MSSSMCWADSFAPIGMPPLVSRTSAATRRKSSSSRRSVNVAGETAGSPSASLRTSAIRPMTLLPGRCPPVPVFAPWPNLKWNAWTCVTLSSRPAELPGCELVEVPGVGLLLLGQHAAFAGADPGAGQLGPFGQRDLGLFGECAETHVGHEEGNVEYERFRGVRADRDRRVDRHVVEQWATSELGGDELDVVPLREQLARNAHRRDRSVMADLREPFGRQLADQATWGSSIVPCGSWYAP